MNFIRHLLVDTKAYLRHVQNFIKFLMARNKADVESFVKTCQIFQQIKYIDQQPTCLLQPLPIPNQMWHGLTMDFDTNLPSYKRNTTIFMVVEHFSKIFRRVCYLRISRPSLLRNHFQPWYTNYMVFLTALCQIEIVSSQVIFGKPSSNWIAQLLLWVLGTTLLFIHQQV